MSLRVLIDATPLPAQRVGVGSYVTALVGALAARGDAEVHVLVKRRDLEELSALAPGATMHAAGPRSRPSRIVWEHTALPRWAKRVRCEVFHGPHYTLPGSLPCPAVVTFHDPTFFTHPDLHERAKVSYFRRAARIGARRASRVIAVSEYARRGAIAHAGVPEDCIEVVPLGVDARRYSPAPGPDDERLRARAGVSGPYVLWVGALEPRKDVPTLVAAFAELVAEGLDRSLVLVGPPAWGAAAITSSIERSAITDRVVRTGYVTEDEKVALYRGADAFVYPSIAEGFGLPVLEAMACGTPVVTTTGSAPEEVAGDAAVLVAPQDTAGLREAIRRVLDDVSVAGELRRRGPERARGFTWDRTAEGTLRAYGRAAGVGRA